MKGKMLWSVPVSASQKRPYVQGMQVPLTADGVAWPEVSYGDELTFIEFLTEEERWGRITFEGLDALRVCRGEHLPYEDDEDSEVDADDEERFWPWVYTVENSPWLVERHAYESKHYRGCYGFGGDVDEMLRDYSHYLFSFHDQFVEAIAAGIWFEESATRFERGLVGAEHPMQNLGEEHVREVLDVEGYRLQIRRNPKPIERLVADSRLCSQLLYQFALELEGRATVDWSAKVRSAKGQCKTVLSRSFGGTESESEGVLPLDALLPPVKAWVAEVKARRVAMGKD